MMTDVKVTRLANGLRVVSSTMPNVGSAAVGIWVGVGARYESERLAGVSHFLEHLMFKGTKKRSSVAISQAIEGCGGYLNAFTQEENTCYYARVASGKLNKALDVLSDMYLNSLYDKVEIERERGVIVEEIMMYRDQPQHLVMDRLGEAMWEGHPLGIPIIGSPETVNGMSRKDIVGFRNDKYVPSNTIVSFAGNLDHDACVRQVEKHMAGIKKKKRPVCRKATTQIKQKSLISVAKEIEQAHLAMGVRIFGRLDDRRIPLRVLNAVLGENMSSRLFQVVREKHGLAYSVHSLCHLYKDTGGFIITAGLDKNRYQKGIELIIREMAKMKEKPVGAAELKRAKEYVTGQMCLGFESTSSHMMYLGDCLMTFGKFIPPEESIARINKVTAQDVQKLAAALFRKSRTSISLVSPGMSSKEQTSLRRLLNNL